MLDNVYEKFLIISPCGSHAYDLDTDESDMDYAVMVLPSDFPEVPEDRPIKLNPIIGETEADYFAHRLDSARNIAYLAGIMYSYPKPPIGGSCKLLVDFWTKNHAELLDIAPKSTYQILTQEIKRSIDDRLTAKYAVSVRHIALLMCRYETGSMIEAVKLNDMWRDRYYAMKRGDIGLDELIEWYQELTSDKVEEYFKTLLVNNSLFAEWKRVVNTVIYNWPIKPTTESEKFLVTFKYDSYMSDSDDAELNTKHTAIVLPSDYPDIPEDYIISESGKTYRLYRLDYMNNLLHLASLVYDYPKPPIGGNCYMIVDFWKNHHADMLDIAPNITYQCIMSEVRQYINRRCVEEYPTAVRKLGLLMCRYETGRMIYAVKLNGLWRDRYYAMKRGDVGIDELMQWYEEINSDSIKMYFEGIPDNRDLFLEWQNVVKTII